MRDRLKVLLLIVGVLTISFGVIDSQAHHRKHRHRVVVKYFFNEVRLPPANDPETSGVESVVVDCPRGYRETGGGYNSSVIAVVPTADLDGRGMQAIGINQTDEAGTLQAQVACIRARTTARRARGGPSLETQVRRLREQRREQLRGR